MSGPALQCLKDGSPVSTGAEKLLSVRVVEKMLSCGSLKKVKWLISEYYFFLS